VRDYIASPSDEQFASVLEQIGRLSHHDLLDFGCLAELIGYGRKLNTLDYPVMRAATGSWDGSRACPS